MNTEEKFQLLIKSKARRRLVKHTKDRIWEDETKTEQWEVDIACEMILLDFLKEDV